MQEIRVSDSIESVPEISEKVSICEENFNCPPLEESWNSPLNFHSSQAARATFHQTFSNSLQKNESEDRNQWSEPFDDKIKARTSKVDKKEVRATPKTRNVNLLN